jgi:hypothetical protein
MSEFRQLTDIERAALRKRTARALNLLEHFDDLPVQVGAPCDVCGGLYWWITGTQRIAPSGYCLNCRPGEIESNKALRKLVAESMLDMPLEEKSPEPEAEQTGQLHLF